MKTLLPATLALLLAACSGTVERLDYTRATSDLRLNALASSVIVRTVQLPTYAASEEIAFESAPGIITTSDELLWSDDPQRAVTLQITAHLNDILSATVGPDPWPFAGLPDVGVDIRVAEMLAGADGVYRLEGQYFVGGDGIDFRNSANAFDIAVPLAGEGPGAVAAAQAAAILSLSEDIARSLGG